MNKPSSFCTICTYNCSFELVGLLLSLSVYHTNEKIYIMSDSKTIKYIKSITPQPKLEIIWFNELDKYDNMDRNKMTQLGIWSDFQMSKAKIIKKTLQYENDTLFLDSDIIITNVIDGIDFDKDIGVSPQFITIEHINNTGYYNGGMLWTKNKNIPDDWIKFTKTSRFYDQASIEDLVKKYSYFEFDDNYNLHCFRYLLSPEGSNKIASYISSNATTHNIYYKNKPLKFIHTHFLDKRFLKFNNIIINHLKNAKNYKILAIIFRVIHNKWILRIPKQPMQGIAGHNNDSYRELAVLLKLNNQDLDLVYDSSSINCWLQPNISTYDRDTLLWFNEEQMSSSLVLLGNCDINVDGKQIINKNPNIIVKPWIYWPRRPIILEKILKENPYLSYNERTIESIFIGNYENSVQEKYRTMNIDWKSVVTEFHCTAGKIHKFSQNEYLFKLRQAKFGLCLRGYGSKCHREVELMAFGTVPLITPNVTIESYSDPLIENIHYIFVNNPNELKNKVETITQEQWEFMSDNCCKWYQKNIHSSNCWNNMINYILYE